MQMPRGILSSGSLVAVRGTQPRERQEGEAVGGRTDRERRVQRLRLCAFHPPMDADCFKHRHVHQGRCANYSSQPSWHHLES